MPHTISGPRVVSAPTSIVHIPPTIPRRKPPLDDEVQIAVSPSTMDKDIHSQWTTTSTSVAVDIVTGSDIPQISPCTQQDFSDKGPSMAKFLAAEGEDGQVYHGLHFSRVGFRVRRASWLPAFVEGTGGGKEILRDIAGVVPPGESMALLGPSGAGKTTLLRVLTNKTPGYGQQSGTVTLDQLPLSSDVLRRCCAFVEQEDASLPALLTTREVTPPSFLDTMGVIC